MTLGIGRKRIPVVLDALRCLLVLLPLVGVARQLVPATWPLAVVALLASVPMMWLPTRPAWLLPSALLTLAATTGTLLVLYPHALLSVALYTTLFYAVRFLQPPQAIATGVLAAGAITTLVFVYQVSIGDALLNVAMLAVVVLLGLNRRGRMARMEQTELALARARTAAEEHAVAATLAERARIARELHDVLAHSLSGLSLNLQSIRLMLLRDGAAEDTLEQVERARRLAADGLSEARNAVAALRDDPVPLECVVNDLLASYRLDTKAVAELEIEGTPRPVGTAATTTLLRAVQEALSNTRKHAPGADVHATLTFGADEVEVCVRDHQDTRPADAGAGGYGLRGMKERAELLGGRLCTGPGEDGWRVHLAVPA